jgi:hypothetical protein
MKASIGCGASVSPTRVSVDEGDKAFLQHPDIAPERDRVQAHIRSSRSQCR